MRSADYIFKTNPSGEQKFVGNFEEFYKFEEDPWQQSVNAGEMSIHYEWSRTRLLNRLCLNEDDNILEIFSGLVFLTKLISKKYPYTTYDGLDISKTAVNKSSKLFPDLNFFREIYSLKNFKISSKYDFILLNQILWYIIKSFPVVINKYAILQF